MLWPWGQSASRIPLNPVINDCTVNIELFLLEDSPTGGEADLSYNVEHVHSCCVRSIR
jgi:hypothetical protein